MSESVTDFLEHYGVKGMQWGVRKRRRQSSNPSQAKTEGQRMVRRAKVNAGVAVAVTAGAIAASYILKQQKDKSVAQMSASITSAGKNFASTIASNNTNTTVPKKAATTAKKVTMSPEATRTLAAMRKAADAGARDANRILKEGYERAQTPFPAREYLKIP